MGTGVGVAVLASRSARGDLVRKAEGERPDAVSFIGPALRWQKAKARYRSHPMRVQKANEQIYWPSGPGLAFAGHRV